MKDHRIKATHVALAALTHNIGTGEGPLATVQDIANLMERAGYKLDILGYGILVDTLGKVGKTKHAEEMVEYMRSKSINPDTIIYNYLVQGMARAKHLDDAVRVVEKMIAEKVPASEATCRPLITNLVRDKKRDHARNILKLCKEQGMDISKFEKTVDR